MLNLIVLYTSQLEACLACYQALGFAFGAEQHGTGPQHSQHYACEQGGLVLELYPDEAANQGKLMLGFVVDNLTEVLENLALLGIVPKKPPQLTKQGRQVTVTDPDGRKLYLVEVTPPS